MDIHILTTFFMWCTIFNVGLLFLSFIFLAFAGDFVYRIHSKWFPMTKETFNVICYLFIGIYKIIVLAFNIIPWIALAIIG